MDRGGKNGKSDGAAKAEDSESTGITKDGPPTKKAEVPVPSVVPESDRPGLDGTLGDHLVEDGHPIAKAVTPVPEEQRLPVAVDGAAIAGAGIREEAQRVVSDYLNGHLPLSDEAKSSVKIEGVAGKPDHVTKTSDVCPKGSADPTTKVEESKSKKEEAVHERPIDKEMPAVPTEAAAAAPLENGLAKNGALPSPTTLPKQFERASVDRPKELVGVDVQKQERLSPQPEKPTADRSEEPRVTDAQKQERLSPKPERPASDHLENRAKAEFEKQERLSSEPEKSTTDHPKELGDADVQKQERLSPQPDEPKVDRPKELSDTKVQKQERLSPEPDKLEVDHPKELGGADVQKQERLSSQPEKPKVDHPKELGDTDVQKQERLSPEPEKLITDHPKKPSGSNDQKQERLSPTPEKRATDQPKELGGADIQKQEPVSLQPERPASDRPEDMVKTDVKKQEDVSPEPEKPIVDHPEELGGADVEKQGRRSPSPTRLPDNGPRKETAVPEDSKTMPSLKDERISADGSAVSGPAPEIPQDASEKLSSAPRPMTETVVPAPLVKSIDGPKDVEVSLEVPRNVGEKPSSAQAASKPVVPDATEKLSGQLAEAPDIGSRKVPSPLDKLAKEDLLEKPPESAKSENGSAVNTIQESLVDSGYKSPNDLGDLKKEVDPKLLELMKPEAVAKAAESIVARAEMVEFETQDLRVTAELDKKSVCKVSPEPILKPEVKELPLPTDVVDHRLKASEAQVADEIPEKDERPLAEVPEKRPLVNGISVEEAPLATDAMLPQEESKEPLKEELEHEVLSHPPKEVVGGAKEVQEEKPETVGDIESVPQIQEGETGTEPSVPHKGELVSADSNGIGVDLQMIAEPQERAAEVRPPELVPEARAGLVTEDGQQEEVGGGAEVPLEAQTESGILAEAVSEELPVTLTDERKTAEVDQGGAAEPPEVDVSLAQKEERVQENGKSEPVVEVDGAVSRDSKEVRVETVRSEVAKEPEVEAPRGQVTDQEQQEEIAEVATTEPEKSQVSETKVEELPSKVAELEAKVQVAEVDTGPEEAAATATNGQDETRDLKLAEGLEAKMEEPTSEVEDLSAKIEDHGTIVQVESGLELPEPIAPGAKADEEESREMDVAEDLDTKVEDSASKVEESASKVVEDLGAKVAVEETLTQVDTTQSPQDVDAVAVADEGETAEGLDTKVEEITSEVEELSAKETLVQLDSDLELPEPVAASTAVVEEESQVLETAEGLEIKVEESISKAQELGAKVEDEAVDQMDLSSTPALRDEVDATATEDESRPLETVAGSETIVDVDVAEPSPPQEAEEPTVDKMEVTSSVVEEEKPSEEVKEVEESDLATVQKPSTETAGETDLKDAQAQVAEPEVVPEKLEKPKAVKKRVTTARPKDGDHDSGVDESTEGKDAVEESPKKPVSLPKDTSATTPAPVAPAPAKGAAVAASPAKKAISPSAATASPAKSSKALGSGPQKVSTPPVAEKKLPMNKVVVGTSPSPNLKVVRSKVGSLDNVKHKAGGGQVRLETKKIDLSNVKSRVGSTENIQHKPSGGDKKITSRKLDWKAQSKVGSLDNATHKPGGGGKKIEVQKLDFKDKAKPKVGSKDNIQHKAGGGDVKIEEHKLEFKDKAKSKVGSMDHVSYKPGGGNVQIFDEKLYYKQQRASSKKSSLTNSDEHISNQSTSPHGPTPQPVSPALVVSESIPESPSPKANGSQTAEPASPVTVAKDTPERKTPEVATEAAKEVQKSPEITATANGTSKEPVPTPAPAAVGTGQQ